MTFFQAIILGIVQGLTEFLPISSSGHLVLTPYLFGWEIPETQVFVFDVLVQMGTIIAVLIYFWPDLWRILKGMVNGLLQRDPLGNPDSKLGWMLVVSSIPAAVIGFVFEGFVESTFTSVRPTAFFLLLTAALLVLAERVGKRTIEIKQLTWKDVLIIGAFQIIALFPGVSRSGSTIAGGMTRNLTRSEAAKFSFLMAVPIMIGAGAWSLLGLRDVPNLDEFVGPLVVGFLVSAVVGYAAIRWLIAFLKTRSLYGFAIYVTIVSILLIALGGAG